ncbi:hypothetical protein ACEQPO_19265 [Bacillus sp. SL00103]
MTMKRTVVSLNRFRNDGGCGQAIMKTSDVSGIAISLPGFVDSEAGYTEFAVPSLP